MTIIPVLIAGGIGERFWPLSRSAAPKQLLALFSPKSMIEETLDRVTPLCPKKAMPLIVTGNAIAAKIRSALPRSARFAIIAEPVGKNTAPAIALAARWIHARYGDSTILVAPADHAISPKSAFLTAARAAAQIAQRQNRLVVFGIKPNRPDTGYGYIQRGRSIGKTNGIAASEVRRFVEKPDARTARRYLSGNAYLWNSGMFVWKTSVILEEFERYMPGLAALSGIAAQKGFSARAINRFYAACEKESIDYGILERSQRVAVVEGSFRWDDVGSWDAIARVNALNPRETVSSGSRIYEYNSSRSIVVNRSKSAVAAIGLRETVLVVTPDAVLAIARQDLPDIKQHLAAIKKSGRFPAATF